MIFKNLDHTLHGRTIKLERDIFDGIEDRAVFIKVLGSSFPFFVFKKWIVDFIEPDLKTSWVVGQPVIISLTVLARNSNGGSY